MSNADYDRYYAKHCARYYGWLPASIAYRKQIKKKPLKYFTLCAEEAIDVFMLEQAGVLSRDKNRNLPNVYICESDEEIAMHIYPLVRPPIREALIIARLERILTFQDNEHTRGRSPDDYDRSRHIRKMLRIKGWAQRLESYFPFDIINFDAYGNFLNPDNEANRLLYQSFERIFELQEPIDTFLLFVTTPITHIHADFQSQFKDDFESNVSTYPEIHSASLSAIGTIAYDEIDENKRTALGFAKSIVLATARRTGWRSEHRGIYIYQNRSLRKMLSSVIQFYKAGTAPDESAYVEDVVRVIQRMPEYYSYEDSLANQEVREHLERVKEYREQIRNEYRE
jgi:hypothetical protein